MINTTRFLICIISLLFSQIGFSESLLDVYQSALRSDPLLREADATRMAALEAKPQARAVLLPQIDGSISFQNVQASGSSQTNRPGGGFFTSLFETDNDTTSWDLQLRQSIFRWDQWVALKQADKQVARADIDYKAAAQDLMARVAAAFFNVLAAQDTLRTEQSAKEAIGRQLEQAQKRFEVGLIAITDVQEAQAAWDLAIAIEISAKRNLANQKEVLREITGEYPGNLSTPKEEIPLLNPEPPNVEEWVDVALQRNLALMSSDIGVEISRDNISIARTGHYPTLDLVASRSDRDTKGKRSISVEPFPLPPLSQADSASVSDTISIQLQVPIFSGGATSSRVRQAVYQHRAAKEQLERVARQTERETRDSYLGVISDISRVKALRQAFSSSQTALEATEAGFEVGTRTTVDVLDARRQLFIAEAAYLSSRYDYIVNVLRLKLSAGTLNVDDLAEVNSWLQ